MSFFIFLNIIPKKIKVGGGGIFNLLYFYLLRFIWE